ncbi:MAG: insulinase family protein [Bacteroides sp.]|nr:insulinase family protein [Prevotella sp.]MCM1407357.1 insulinase family protein [Treponema brennaborense]MCM1469847.1 insulinase family protein [Bacteroides sp.]
MSAQSELKPNDVYNGFSVVDVTPLESYGGVGILLVHNRTGMQIFHIFNADAENLFAFSFATPPEDSKGTAHILEHSVLCGSEKYPLKDPFVQLCTQSVKTFLNAMTFSDKTVYPASSISEADYFNLMSVYADAVFFPLLDERIFAQEAHRLEYGADGKLAVQGVVYNEMRGNYASFENVVSDRIIQNMLPGTPYAFDSGGDPAVIPELTYDDFKKFYQKAYTPANCRLFLYGNISTKKQLDFLSGNFLNRIDIVSEPIRSAGIPYPPPCVFSEPNRVSCPAPAEKGGAQGASVLISWLLGDASDPLQYLEAVFVNEILIGHDGSPLTKALLESGLGEDISPNSGIDGEMRYLLFSAGLRGMKKEDAEKLEQLVLSVIGNLCENGVSKEDIDSAAMSVEFSDREIVRAHGPYALVLMRRALRGWLYGAHPAAALRNREVFETIKQNLAADADAYLRNLLRRFFIDNPHRLCITVYPDENYEKSRMQALEKRLALHTSGMSDSQKKLFEDSVREQQAQLAVFQQTADPEEKKELIPHLSLSDLSAEADCIKTEETLCGNTRLFLHNEPTNGIVYIDFAVPADVLSPEEYVYLPFFALYCTNCGFDGLDWAAAASLAARLTGAYSASVLSSSTAYPFLRKIGAEHLQGTELSEALFRYDPVIGRDWLIFRIKMLEEHTEEAVRMLFRSLRFPDFSDTARIRDLLAEAKNDMAASVIPAGNEYAVSRAACCFSKSKAVDELCSGLSQYVKLSAMASADASETAAVLHSLHKKLFGANADNGAVCNITADLRGIAAAKKALAPHITDMPPLKPPRPAAAGEFYSQTIISADAESSASIGDKSAFPRREIYTIPSQVGFAAAAFPCSPFGSPESVCESVAAHWLTNTLLWEKIRTVGGAYGAFALADGIERIYSISSYRDPDPEKSASEFIGCIRQAAQKLPDRKNLERMITGVYSKEKQPRSPAARGSAGFMRRLYGVEDAARQEKLRCLLAVSSGDMQETFHRLLAAVEQQKTAIIFRKTEYMSGTIIPILV